MSGQVIQRGDRRCKTCGLVHDCWLTSEQGASSWAHPEDGHPYKPESWHEVAIRYGFTIPYEREFNGVAA